MEAILYYLLKVSIGTAVFYATYHFLFRKNKQFVFNRIYLSGSFIAAFIIPLITFQTTSYFSRATTYFPGNAVTVVLPTQANVASNASGMEVAGFLMTLYLFGLVFCLVKLIYGYTVAAGIRKNCREKNIGGMKVWVAEEDNLAFTFIDKVIIGKNLLHHPALEMVLNHEAVHSREQHFYDIILAELLLILQWFNPFASFHAQAIRNNLEFLADDKVIKAADKQQYQMTMLSMALNHINSPLFTAINSSNLKKRIMMMNSKKANQFSDMARLAFLPVFVLILVSLSEKKMVMTSDGASEMEQSSQLSEALQEKPTAPIGSIKELNKFLASNLKYPAEARAGGLVGTARIYARVNTEGNIIEVLDVKPDEEYMEYDEVVIIGYVKEDTENIKKTKSYRHPSLLTEGKRAIESLPTLKIAEFQGKLIQFNFKFDLR